MRTVSLGNSSRRAIRGLLWTAGTIALLTGLLLGQMATAQTAKTSTISGRIVDAQSGEALVGVTVMVSGTKLGAYTDVNGNFTIRYVPEGKYTLVISMIGYTATQVTDVAVSADTPTRVSLALNSQLIELEGIVVQAKKVTNTEASLLKQRKMATAVGDAISSEAISRSGSGDAAQALMRVTGASTDGKNVLVRGLGDRYGNTQLNGSLLPSPDPERQSVPMDLIPSNLLDNIVVSKSFTADKPGNFSGGSINLVTKDFPESRMLTLSTGATHLKGISGQEALTQDGSSTDWLGYDNGLRDMPGTISDPADLARVPNGRTIFFDPAAAHFADELAHSFNRTLDPKRASTPLNRNFSMSYGDNVRFLGRSLGMVASLSYNRSFSFYQKGRRDTWFAEQAGDQLRMEPYDLFSDSRSTDEVLWGGLGSLTYSLSKRHTIGFNYVRNQNGEMETRVIEGYALERIGDSSSTFRSRVLGYTERSLSSSQLRGTHQPFTYPLRLEWQLGYSHVTQEQPDNRLAADDYTYMYDDGGNVYDTVYRFGSSFTPPARYWRNINEKNREFNLTSTIPVFADLKVKLGGNYMKKTRNQRQSQFYLQGGASNEYSGSFDEFLQQTGIKDSTLIDPANSRYRYNMYSYWTNATYSRDQYDAHQIVSAGFGQIEARLLKKLDVVLGLRYEKTDMYSKNQDTARAADIQATDWLPAVSLLYHMKDDMNVRFAFGRTLARPSLREISTFAAEEFTGSRFLHGNPDLDYTKIQNYDVRWEWFFRPNEIAAVSLFYKKFEDPIEVAMFGNNYDRKPINVPEATSKGLEFELRTSLDRIAKPLRNFSFGGNFTLVSSKVQVAEEELLLMRRVDPSAEGTRTMAGQSPYLLNLNLGFASEKSGTRADVLYNVFGRRFYYNAPGGTPDVYEKPRHLVDLTVTQNLFRGVSVSLAAKNILNSEFQAVYLQTGSSNEITYEKHEIGRSFGIGLSYKVW